MTCSIQTTYIIVRDENVFSTTKMNTHTNTLSTFPFSFQQKETVGCATCSSASGHARGIRGADGATLQNYNQASWLNNDESENHGSSFHF